MRLFILTTAGCHLCDQALVVLQQLAEHYPFELELIDIASNDQLVEQYGIKIPVVADGQFLREIGWPFSQGELVELFFTETGNSCVV